MWGKSDLIRMLHDLPRDRASNVEAFMRQIEFDPIQFETTVRKQFPDLVDMFFVSTVARGLAGSMSDIDVIVITAARPNFQRMSIMVHAQGRRLGVKHYSTDELAHVREVLAGSWAMADLVQPVVAWLDRVTVDWVDCERVANGFSYATGTPWCNLLPALSELWLWEALMHAREATASASLSVAAGERRAAYGYLLIGLAYLRECVMAQCGDIQSNSKWTGERWSRFRPRIADRDIARLARDLDVHEGWLRETKRDAPSEAATRLHAAYVSVRGLSQDVPLDDSNLFRSLGGRARRRFFSASVAVALEGGRIIMMPHDHPLLDVPLALDELERVPPPIAELVLTLLRTGTLSLSGVSPQSSFAPRRLRQVGAIVLETVK